MEQNFERIDENTTVETTIRTPEDGLVSKRETNPVDMDTRGQFQMGYSVNKTYTTSDPKVTRPFAYGICALFFLIGIFQLAHAILSKGNLFDTWSNWFFGIVFLAFAIICFIKSKQDIDAIAKKKEEEDSK